MIYARAPSLERIRASPGETGICPLCGGEVISKCGEVNVWHWAHKSLIECDTWSEGETAWHAGWKELVQPRWAEFDFGPHRADVIGNGLTVIELQHSPISADTIKEREVFYPKMMWLFDATNQPTGKLIIFTQYETITRYTHIVIPIPIDKNITYCDFRWKHARRSIRFCKSPVFLDLGEWILAIRKFDANNFIGWGYRLSRSYFINKYLSETLKGVS